MTMDHDADVGGVAPAPGSDDDGNDDGNDLDLEDDLQAAIALSMQQQQQQTNVDGDDDDDDDDVAVANDGIGNNDSMSMKKEHDGNDRSASPKRDVSMTNAATFASAALPSFSNNHFDCRSFHGIMWDDAATTSNDKQRWIYECISTPFLQGAATAADSAGVSASVGGLKSPPEPAAASNSNDDGESLTLTPLEIFSGSRYHGSTSQSQQQQHNGNGNAAPTLQPRPQQLWGLRTKVGGDSGISTLQAYLETSGAGIILWNDFWICCSRLMTGSSLENAISSGDDSMQVDFDLTGDDDGPPMLITQFGEDDKVASGMALPSVFALAESAFAPTPMGSGDEELAKRLAAEWGSMSDSAVAVAASPSAVAASGDQTAKSDEDYARELQAQWDAEDNAAGSLVDLSSQAATTDDVATLASVSDRPPTPIPDKKMPAKKGSVSFGETTSTTEATTETENGRNNPSSAKTPLQQQQQQLDFEKHGLSFPLYHYNGLYGGTLTHFRLTRLSPTEAVGASIALSSEGGGSGHGTGGGGDLEDVVRTKWPSSMLNWFGKNPPSID